MRAAVVFPLAISVMVTIARDNSRLFGLTLLQEGYLVEPAGRLYLSLWNLNSLLAEVFGKEQICLNLI